MTIGVTIGLVVAAVGLFGLVFEGALHLFRASVSPRHRLCRLAGRRAPHTLASSLIAGGRADVVAVPPPTGDAVFAVGEVDYDVREEQPAALFSTVDAAKAYAGEGVAWEQEGPEHWFGRGPRGREWSIRAFIVDDPEADLA